VVEAFDETPDRGRHGLAGEGGIRRVACQCASQCIDCGQFAVTEFALDDVGKAVAHAAQGSARFALTVVRP
jgi:alcohol dehydrogenase